VVAVLCYEYSINGVFFEVGLKTRFCLVCQFVRQLFWIMLFFIARKS
jgi:hypothetical protein